MKFKGDIIITDPCYIMRAEHHGTKPLTEDDWNSCNYGKHMGVLGINTYLTRNTEYGDWSCTTLKDTPESKEILSKLNENYTKLWENQGADEALQDRLVTEREEILKSSDIVLGEFCADAGLVSVFLLEEVLAYNPDFDYHINKPWTTTLIKDFDGDIEITHRVVNEESGETEVSVIGRGNIDFYTTQTGL